METRAGHLETEDLAREDADILGECFNLGPIGASGRTMPDNLPYATGWDLLKDDGRVGRNNCDAVSVDQEIGKRAHKGRAPT